MLFLLHLVSAQSVQLLRPFTQLLLTLLWNQLQVRQLRSNKHTPHTHSYSMTVTSTEHCLPSCLFSVNSSISSHLALLSTLLFPSCFLTLLQTCAQSLLPRAMRCWGQPTVNSLGPAQRENATIHAVSVILHQMFETICWNSCIGRLMTSVAGNLFRKSKRFVCVGLLIRGTFANVWFKRRLINGCTYLLTFGTETWRCLWLAAYVTTCLTCCNHLTAEVNRKQSVQHLSATSS